MKFHILQSASAVLTGLLVVILPATSLAYGSATTHREVTEAIFGGYGGDDFREFFDATSGAVDSIRK